MTQKDGKMDITVRPATVQNPTGKEFSVTFTLWGGETEQLREIITVHLPAWAALFASKNSEYGSGDASSGTALGVKGQFADIWRKIGKLKTALWDGNESALVTEGVDEILLDLIGHCFLTLEMRAQSVRSPAPKRASAIRLDSPREAYVSPALQSLLVERGVVKIQAKGGTESYDMGNGVWINVGGRYQIRHHLGRGGTFTLVALDSARAEGMIALLETSVDKGEMPEQFWTNPDWLVPADDEVKMSERIPITGDGFVDTRDSKQPDHPAPRKRVVSDTPQA